MAAITEITMESRQKVNRLIFVPLITVLVLILITVCIMAFVMNRGENAGHSSNEQGRASTENAFGHQEAMISYKGKNYYFNNHIKTYLFMGIDDDNPVQVHEGAGSGGGRSDAMFLLVADEENQSLSIISINRNSITDVEVFSTDGTSLGVYDLQICLQHTYGDGGAVSCERSVEAVSNLFYNLPVDGYIALNMGAIPSMNDAVGGVEVDILQDISDESRGVKLKKGDTVSLTGDEAYVYIRNREDEEFDSATDRLCRQEQYMAAYMEKLQAVAAEDASSAAAVYAAIADYTVTDLDAGSMISELLDYSYDPQHMYTVPGGTVAGESLEEYHVDDSGLYELILSVFYKEAGEI